MNATEVARACVSDVNGRILRMIVCRRSILDIQAQPGEILVEGEGSDVDHYIDVATKIITPRPTLSLIIDVLTPKVGEVVTLSGLPTPCVLSINGTEYPVAESSLELTFPLVKNYVLKVTQFPYRDWEEEIHVTD